MSQRNIIIVIVVLLVLALITLWFIRRGKAPQAPISPEVPVGQDYEMIPEAPIIPGPEVPVTPTPEAPVVPGPEVPATPTF